jgi:hypothetical protein
MSGVYKYSLGKKDAPALERFFTKYEPLLAPYVISLGPYGGDDPVGVALTMYNDAVLRATSTASKITAAITSLEALYLENNAELSYRLRLRVASLLRAVNVSNPPEAYPAAQVFEDVREAYKIRSSYLHGSSVTKITKDCGSLCEKIIEYARVSILAFLQMKGSHGLEKEDILKMLDHALVDDKSAPKVGEYLRDLQATSGHPTP